MIRIADEVREASAVVALETTLVAHGFPAGEGLAVAAESERRIRDVGAVPATIGVLDGEIRVGLSPEELERFDADARKVGPRDLAVCVVQRAVGARTVACEFLQPATSPSSSAASHARRAAASSSSGTELEWSMLPTAARCFAMTPVIAAAFGW